MRNVCPAVDVIPSAEPAVVLIQWMSFIRREAEAENAAESGLPACWRHLPRQQVVVVPARRREQICVLRFCTNFMILQIDLQRMEAMALPAMRRCVSDAGAVI